MDVRCEKCQTEYELDEARLKPGGVTVKCTNCGHMFKIRKRTPTNAGVPTVQQVADSQRNKPPSRPQTPNPARQPRADSMLDEAVTSIAGEDGPTTVERQWLIRLENGDQKSCRELAILQQWIVAGVVTRESLISRTGKTWKRLGDIAELVQYFDIGEEARTTRDERRASPTNKPPHRDEAARGTMLGVGGPTAAGGTILPDDDEGRTTGNYQARAATKPPPLPGPKVLTKTPPMGSNSNPPAETSPPPKRKPLTTPPPPPPKKLTDPPPASEASSLPSLRGAPPPGNRATAAWATDGADRVGAAGTTSASSSKSEPSGPYHGKLAAIPDEPAFAGKVRVSPPDEASFDTGRMRRDDDDEDLLPKRKGSSAGLLILFMVLIVGSGAAALVYYFVIREKPEQQVKTPADASLVAQTPDAAPIVTPMIDAAVPVVSPLDTARSELATDNEARMRVSYDGLSGKDEPAELAVRANLGAALAQAFIDRASVSGEKNESEKLRKDAKTLALEAATAAQKALKFVPDDPGASVAMAHVLRLQGKPAKDLKRYIDAASAKPGAWARDIALANALVLQRDGKLADAKVAFAAIDSGDGKLEMSNDVRARFHLALIALAEEKDAEAKPLVDQILVAQPEHAGAKALAAKLETRVAKTDPLPPEDPKNGSAGGGSGSGRPRDPVDPPVTGDYDGLVRRADQLAQTSCVKAIEMYTKALEKKPNGVEALTGLGYCHLDAKNFASAHSRFRTALVISSRYEPALAGIAEAYQQQGRKEDAIAAWRRYLEAYPGSKKALAALDRLGASATPPDPPTGSGSGSAEQPPPQPQPQPQPSQPGQPVGSGSG